MSDEQAREVYARAGLGASVTLGSRPCVLVIDFSCGFTDPGCALGSDLTAEVEATRRLLDVARERGRAGRLHDDRVRARASRTAASGCRRCRRSATCSSAAAGWRSTSGSAAREDETVIVKKGASGFFGTNLASVLVSQGVDTVILCGATTSGCVRATAIDLLQYGWPTIVPGSASATAPRRRTRRTCSTSRRSTRTSSRVDDALAYLERVSGKVGTAA